VKKPSQGYDELDVQQSPTSSDTVGCQPDVHVLKARSVQDSGMLEIVIDPRDRPGETLPPLIEATPKEKGTKAGVLSFTRWQRIHWMNQFFGRVARSQRQVQNHQMPFNRSIRFTLVFMLAIFLLVPFLVYSN